MILESTLQQTLKKLPLSEFCCSVKEMFPQLSVKATKYSTLLYIHICVRSDFSLCISSKTIYHNILEADMRYQLSY